MTLRGIVSRALVVLASVVLGLGAMELLVRVVGEWVDSGQFYFRGARVRPYVIPFDAISAAIDDYNARSDESRYQYDAMLGWRYPANFSREEGDLTTNSARLRAARDYPLVPADDTVRVALFGDSFVAGGEVDDDETWAVALETALANAGIRAEVLNFGVDGYGTDQANLLWQSTEYEVDMVLFGLQPSNIGRNVNVFRPVLSPTTNVPFSKPRYVLDEGDLRVINQPTVPPDEVIETLRQFPNHDLAPYETYDQPARFIERFKLVGVVQSATNPSRGPLAGVADVPAALALTEAIFDDAAAKAGARPFVVVHLPELASLGMLNVGDNLPYQPLLDALNSRYAVLSPHVVLTEEPFYWMPGGHYSPYANQQVGEWLAGHLIACLTDESCLPPRFDSSEAYLQ